MKRLEREDETLLLLNADVEGFRSGLGVCMIAPRRASLLTDVQYIWWRYVIEED